MIRCKMKLIDVIPTAWGPRKAYFSCEYDPKVCEEDLGFQKATPQGDASFLIDNPKAIEQLVIGGTYYVDFSPT